MSKNWSEEFGFDQISNSSYLGLGRNGFVFLKHIILALLLGLFGGLGFLINGWLGVALVVAGLAFVGTLVIVYVSVEYSKQLDRTVGAWWLAICLGSVIFGFSSPFLFLLGNILGILTIFLVFAGLAFWYN